MNVNPYQSPEQTSDLAVSYGDYSRRVRGGFLFREIQFGEPFVGRFVYNGWNFLQRIHINGNLVWQRVSWIVIHKRAAFTLPAEVDPLEREMEVRITFARGLIMRRFEVFVGGQQVYDE